MNIASAGKFSSDRSIMNYAQDIWNVESLSSKIPTPNEERADSFDGENEVCKRRESIFDEKKFSTKPLDEEF
jgi:hypothetical protein